MEGDCFSFVFRKITQQHSKRWVRQERHRIWSKEASQWSRCSAMKAWRHHGGGGTVGEEVLGDRIPRFG